MIQKRDEVINPTPKDIDYDYFFNFLTTPIAIPTTPAQKKTMSVEFPVIVVITVLTTSISEPTAVVIVLPPVSAKNIRHFSSLNYFIVMSDIKAFPEYPQP